MVDEPRWPGARNLRDLGGRALRGGGLTLPGRIFRSGAVEYLTDAGWAAARAAGVLTVVDLRNAPMETARGPHHPAVAAECLAGFEFVPAPTEDPDDPEFLRVCGPWLDHPRGWADNLRLAPARLARVMRAVGAAPGAVLVHCAGGRDRTGLVSAMLLDLAGATPEAIADDYADGWRGAGAYAGHGWAYDPAEGGWRPHRTPAASPAVIEQQIAERLPALRHWVATFDTGAYLAAAGLGPRDLQSLRDRLLA